MGGNKELVYLKRRQTMLDITLIGCGGTMPLPDRAVQAVALRCGGSVLLLDCGEGTQAAARRAGVSLYKIDAIALTHYHGDHIFGLPGLLQTMASLGRTAPVWVFGPQGLAGWLAPICQLCGPLPFELRAREVCVGANRAQDVIALGKLLPAWGAAELTAFPVEHRVRCCGYRLALPRPGRFSPEAALALGVPQRQWKNLQRGESVALENGQTIQPTQVLGAPRKGLAVVLGTDTRPCETLRQAAQGADLLICDATYPEDDHSDKAAEYGHSTWAESAALAARAGAKRLWLSHYSVAVADPQTYLPAAQAIFPAAECGFDGKQLCLRFEE
jgi:ribonuclease Z